MTREFWLCHIAKWPNIRFLQLNTLINCWSLIIFYYHHFTNKIRFEFWTRHDNILILVWTERALRLSLVELRKSTSIHSTIPLVFTMFWIKFKCQEEWNSVISIIEHSTVLEKILNSISKNYESMELFLSQKISTSELKASVSYHFEKFGGLYLIFSKIFTSDKICFL